ncbi:MAG TPA: hypothetical protein DCE85_10025 [Sulfitobacter sp.]|nr:hypothetical protein [Sulfitobacter sp.]
MKAFSVFVLIIATFGMPSFASAHTQSATPYTSEVPSHGGGCRKSSPPGQCCHAGSEPYHCH